MAVDTANAAAQTDTLRLQHPVKTKEANVKMVNVAEHHSDIDIIDIRREAVEVDLKVDLMSMLKPDNGPKTMPTLLLYDEQGLQIFEKITFLEEYYLTNAEIEVLTKSAGEMARHIQSGSMVVELGSGNLRKVNILLEALDAAGKDIDYYALDLSLTELERTLDKVPAFKSVRCHGLHGTYDDGLIWLKSAAANSRPKCILSLGSSIGNFTRPEALGFLNNFANVLGINDSILIGLDACVDAAKVFHAYNDREGLTHEFILNGLKNANRILDQKAFDVNDWKVIGEYVHDDQGGRHQAHYSPNKDVTACGVPFKAGERVQVEQSLKYSEEDTQILWQKSNLREVSRWSASTVAYNVHLLAKQNMPFLLNPKQYAASTIPSVSDWKNLWAVWDTVTRAMIPDAELKTKPIKLRNACIFYLGHIPTFLDLQLSQATNQPLCKPSSYPQIFERGIDPDVDNPEICHPHSESPDEWPPLSEILEYQSQVRAKVEGLYDCGSDLISRKIGRSLWIGLEHEILHLETLLYMLLQSDKTLPPPCAPRPDFENEAAEAEKAAVPNEWFTIPEQGLTLGLEDPEDNSGPDRHFGWDNEKPPRKVTVHSFQAQARPISNKEYFSYLESSKSLKIPASWAHRKPDGTERKPHVNSLSLSNGDFNDYTNGQINGIHKFNSISGKIAIDDIAVRTVYGLIPLRLAQHWPVFASYDELSGCASWLGGRIPTVEEARSIYSHVDSRRRKEAEQKLSKTTPAVNGHLVNNGVEETPPSRPVIMEKSSSQQDLFVNLEQANVGFKRWCPTAVTANGRNLAGQAEMGGVWEWTSSILEKTEGFEPMKLYPAYTADFFDQKHNIVLGGSWATHPRIAGRKTFVNWYQRNYPYAWIGARLVRDLQS